MKEKFLAYQIEDETSEVYLLLLDDLYRYFANYPFDKEYDYNELIELCKLVLNRIVKTIKFYNDNVSLYIEETLARQKEHNALNIDNFYDKIYSRLVAQTELYNNNTFKSFVKSLINEPNKTRAVLESQLRNIYDYFEKIIHYKVTIHDKKLFENLPRIKQPQALKDFDNYSLEISDPELSDINKYLLGTIDSLLGHFKTEIITKPLIQKYEIGGRKITLEDVLRDDFKRCYSQLLLAIKNDNLNLVDANGNWIAHKYNAYLLYCALSENGIIEKGITRFGEAISNEFEAIGSRSFQKIALNYEQEEELIRLKDYFARFKEKLSK